MMADNEIYDALRTVAKSCGYYDIALYRNDDVSYMDNDTTFPVYQLVILQQIPSETTPTDIIGWNVYARLADTESIFNAVHTPVMIVGNSWKKCKERLEELAKDNMEVMLNEDLALIKPHETFEEAMIRCNLTVNA